MPVDVVLFQPEIPPNTGNVIRLCANTGARLHLVRPLGFRLDAQAVRRASLDYGELTDLREYASLDDCLRSLGHPRWYAFSTTAVRRHDEPRYERGDAFVFGPETRGLPETVLEACSRECRIRIPVRPGARSLNLSNAVAVAVYEAWRQLSFDGA